MVVFVQTRLPFRDMTSWKTVKYLSACAFILEAKVGFEPTWAKPTAYKTVPIDHYGTWPYNVGF